MGTGFAEAPLAVFTTLAPMGAAAFVMLFAAALKGAYANGAEKALDRMTAIPLVLVLAGFVGAFFHLAAPMNAPYALLGVGRSPLTNEIAVGCVFFVVAVVYWALAMTGKLSQGARTGFLGVLAVLAVVFAAFCGAAYLMDTIPTWNQPTTVVQMIGYGLLGGAAVGSLVLGAAKVELPAGFGIAATVVAVAGLALAVVCFGLQIASCADIRDIWGAAIDLVPAIWGIFAALVIGGIVACGLVFAGTKGARAQAALLGAAAVVAIVVVFFARIGFYGLHMTIGM